MVLQTNLNKFCKIKDQKAFKPEPQMSDILQFTSNSMDFNVDLDSLLELEFKL